MQFVSGTNRRVQQYMSYAVLKVENYSNEMISENCYPGVVHGKVIGGLLDGKTVSVALRKTLTNQRVTQIADLQNQNKLSYTSQGGYIALESVKLENGKLTAQWLNRMGDKDAIIRSKLPTKIAPFYDRTGHIHRFKINNATIYNAHILDMPNSNTASSEDELRSILTNTFANFGAAMVAFAPISSYDSGQLERQTHLGFVGWREQNQMSVEEATEYFLSQHENVVTYLKAGALIDVIPLETMRLGSRVCESIDAGGKSSVPISRYTTGGLGARIQSAIRRCDAKVGEKIECAFLAQANPKAKDTFTSLGWKGVWNKDIAQFFATANIILPMVAKFGFAVSTSFLKPYTSSEGELYLAKSRPLTVPLPRDAIPTPSDPSAHTRYYASIYGAVTKLADYLPDNPSNQFESLTTKAKIKASIDQDTNIKERSYPASRWSDQSFDFHDSDPLVPEVDEFMNF